MAITNVDFGKMRQFDFSINGKAFEVYEFEAEEAIFSCFTIEVTIVSSFRLVLNDYVNKEALFTMIGRKTDRYFHGLVSRFTYEEEKGRYFMYKALVVPYFAMLDLMTDVRIFQNKTTKEIVTEILEENHILSNSYDFREHAEYTPREYCVQYRETSFEFISRILAEEGMFYYFEFTEKDHIIVFGDMFGCHKDITGDKEVIFSAPGQLVDNQEYITYFDISTNITSGKVVFKDYDFEEPSRELLEEKQHKEYDTTELYDYPGYLTNGSTNTVRPDTALDRAIFEQSFATGKSICRRITSGHTFVLKEHVLDELNKEYIITSVSHFGRQPQALQEIADSSESNTYSNTFRCIMSDANFKPSKPIKPSVNGIQTAIVTGPAGEEIHVDEYGRIKAQFHWDRKGNQDENSSCWLRVAQSFSGGSWGSLFIPRIGQEVIVNFIDGDPDRPVVTGALYNGNNKLPYSLPQEKTKSTIKTNTTPGGGGFNELRFEDKSGEEEIYIHGQKDWNIEIKNDKGQHIGHDEKLTIDNDRAKEVKHDQQESIGNNKDIKVTKNHNEDIGENSTHSIGKNSTERVGENKTIDILKNREETIGENSKINVSKQSSCSVGDTSKVSIGKSLTETIGTELKADVGDKAVINITKDLSVMVGTKTILTSEDEITLKCGSSSLIMKSDGTIQFQGADIKLNASGKLVLKGQAISKN